MELKVIWKKQILFTTKEMQTKISSIEPSYFTYTDMLKTHGNRSLFINHYSYAVPCLEAIEIIKSYSPVLEIGAGSGYWASCLVTANCNIIATDPYLTHPFEENYFKIEKLKAVEAIEKYPERNLLMIWPGMSSWAAEALMAFKGQHFIYIGEGLDGCCANDEFFNVLENEYEVIERMSIPQFFGIHDDLTVWRKK